ncbi:hypothetical protein C5B91_13205 [Haloferax sp. Atlit-10N]|uniref:DUF7847 domain-containing protein n=1 Tax=Haloferax prahovense (strain DSM 18310 / JCM 13924 / TL6) TaxID=1227461 RepID=M0GP24_HALPT|nr:MULTISPECIES: hypothetical protein [Haloferax]ELZ73930.1 hypothetical protein C457_01565 [Haloferax prahovense DSM 18310]RDZ42922.1 hypothetical protein C5B86_14640 [Haloferax sp. Atlit-19N]RDZ43084.1 hypothetical protein C5B87_14035 [Haloferax sp. Atlit-16N]RDZ57659.1 hypothetical protein C5B91_13205 [Haloferax sp. Atlit-10N]
MTVLQSFRTTLQVVTKTPVLVAFALTFGLMGALNNATGLVSVVGAILVLFGSPALIGAFYTVIDGARPGSDTDLRASTAAQRYYVSLLGASILSGLVIMIVALVVGGGVVGYIGFDRIDAVLNGSASLTLVELAAAGAAFAALAAVVYLFTFFDTAVVFDGKTAGGSLSRSVDFVFGNLRHVVGYAVVATVATSVVDLPVLWLVSLDGATTVAGAVTAFQAPMPAVDIAVLAVASTVTTLVGRTYKVCFYRACTDAVPGSDPDAADDEWSV